MIYYDVFMSKDTKIITHLTYSSLFNTFEKGGIFLMTSTLRNVEDFKSQIEYLLGQLNPIELIQFSSFLNMIVQTRTTEKTLVRGVSFLEETKLVPKGTGFVNKIVFHRENLLNLIGQILESNIKGDQQLTGEGYLENQQKYCKAILLNNDLLLVETDKYKTEAELTVYRDYFIREWPHYYLPDIARHIYKHRIIRYQYCFENLLSVLEVTDRNLMEAGIQSFEQKSGVSLSEYMKVLTGLYAWFFEIPIQNEQNATTDTQPKLGFDFQNVSSFYIDSRLFSGDPSFIKTIETISKDIEALKKLVADPLNTRDPIHGYNKNIRLFFDNPVFKISEGYYCVIDLKFVIENVCGGMLWRLRNDASLQDFKSAYGRLMEEYFKFVIRNIFKEAKITFGEGAGADAVVEFEDSILVIEFTTEYYRLSSLYNPTSEGFIDDAYRLLFNSGKEDVRARGKSDRGKLLKLNDYIIQHEKIGKTIIPVLVTENILGDHDLFNSFGGFYDKEVSSKRLDRIANHTPLFLSLDDLETFWGYFEPKESVNIFTEFAKYWVNIEKGPLFHNASAGMHSFVESKKGKGEAKISNHDFADFFSNKQVFKE